MGIQPFFWPSYTDLMAGVSLTLVLLVALSWVHVRLATSRTSQLPDLCEELGVDCGNGGDGTDGRGGSFDAIRLRESLLFDINKAEIKPEGKPILEDLGRRLLQVLDNPEKRKLIDAILVEGHTDSTGSDSWNWRLSAERAIAVVEYLYEAVPELRARYPRYLAAVGYSKYRPARDETASWEESNQTPEERQANRRIEIRVHVRNPEVAQQLIQEILTPGPQAELGGSG